MKLVPLNRDHVPDPYDEKRALVDANFQARLQLDNALTTYSRFVPEAELRDAVTNIDWARARYEKTVEREARAWRRRAEALERVIRHVVARVDLAPDARTDLLALLYGTAAARCRDEKLLSDVEANLIAHYRAMDAAGRQMLRTLCERLATSSEKGGAQVAAPAPTDVDERDDAGRPVLRTVSPRPESAS